MRTLPRKDPSERFDAFVFPDPNSGCFIWAGVCDKKGYGRFNFGDNRTGFAHRFAFERARGPIPAGMNVLHKCDTPCCVNPDHLYLGSLVQNAHDMARRERGRRGKLPYGAKRNPHGYRFIARVTLKRKTYYLGGFDSAEEASSAAVACKQELRSAKEI